jgi:hypothetical protein
MTFTSWLTDFERRSKTIDAGPDSGKAETPPGVEPAAGAIRGSFRLEPFCWTAVR